MFFFMLVGETRVPARREHANSTQKVLSDPGVEPWTLLPRDEHEPPHMLTHATQHAQPFLSQALLCPITFTFEPYLSLSPSSISAFLIIFPQSSVLS